MANLTVQVGACSQSPWSSSSGGAVNKATEYFRYWFFPCTNPAETLSRISEVAGRNLVLANCLGIRRGSMTARLHKSLDDWLSSRAAQMDNVDLEANILTSQSPANTSFETQRMILETTIAELVRVCNRMVPKIERSRIAPTEENSVKTEIASIFAIMLVLSGREEYEERQQELKNVNGVDRNRTWRILNPLFERAEKIQERVVALREFQLCHSAYAHLIISLTKIKDLLNVPPGQTLLIESIEHCANEISECLGKKAPLLLRLRTFITQIQDNTFHLDTARDWVQDKISKYTLLKEDNYNKMQAEMGRISAEASALYRDVEAARDGL